MKYFNRYDTIFKSKVHRLIVRASALKREIPLW
nr:MAG TPA: hypothetical protein [Caudoviricetes sp.]DAM97921.1 MAG TPA: hypothetical protein [Caudoviricetes sp.]